MLRGCSGLSLLCINSLSLPVANYCIYNLLDIYISSLRFPLCIEGSLSFGAPGVCQGYAKFTGNGSISIKTQREWLI